MDDSDITGGCDKCRVPSAHSPRADAAAGSATAVAATVLSVLPSFTCPACLAAYAGVLSAAGLGFLLNEAVLRPLIAVVLVLNLLALAWTARSHRSPGPLLLAGVATGVLVAGRFATDLDLLLYGGSAGLLFAALWNLWLKRPTARTASTVARA